MQGDSRLIDVTNDANPTGYRWASSMLAAQGKRSGKPRATRPLQRGLEFTAKMTATLRLTPT